MKNKLLKKKNTIMTRNWFDQWSNEYDRTLGSISFHRELLDLVVKNSKVKNGDRLLDVGCGTGLLSLKFLQKASCLVTAIDSSKEMMAIFKNKINKLNLDKKVACKLMDAESLDFKKDTFDIAASSVVLHHLKNKLTAIKKIYNTLKPGGIFLIGEVDMDTTGSHTDINRLKRILKVLEEEWICALKDVGVEAFAKMFQNGMKHIFNQGEYCISLKQWANLCRKAGFKRISIKRLPRYKTFGVVVAKK